MAKPRTTVDVKFKLPLLEIGINDVSASFKRGREAGPFVITSRTCGMALDTGDTAQRWIDPIIWPTRRVQ